MRNLLIGLTSILYLSACTSTNTLVINVKKPAEVTLPSNIHNIVFVNNSILPENINHEIFVNNIKTSQTEKVSTDSIDIIIMQDIYEKITTKGYFQDVTLYPDLTRTDTDYENEIELDPEKVAEIASSMNCDAVITLDQISFVTKSNTRSSYDYVDVTLNFLDLDMKALFRIFSKEGKAISPAFIISDSIYWVETKSGKELLSDSLPTIENALKSGAMYLSERISNAFTPYWSSETRIYYGDGKEAIKKIDKNRWEEAKSIWQKEFENETKPKRKARLANNIALTYELTDNLTDAAKWAQISCDLFSEEQSTSIDKNNLAKAIAYKEILINRIKDFRILDIRNSEY